MLRTPLHWLFAEAANDSKPYRPMKLDPIETLEPIEARPCMRWASILYAVPLGLAFWAVLIWCLAWFL
jgi:hypothetical protein